VVGVALLTSSSASLPHKRGLPIPRRFPPVKALALAAKRPPKGGLRPPALASPFGESGRGALRAPSGNPPSPGCIIDGVDDAALGTWRG
jgi:hypothetical protein